MGPEDLPILPRVRRPQDDLDGIHLPPFLTGFGFGGKKLLPPLPQRSVGFLLKVATPAVLMHQENFLGHHIFPFSTPKQGIKFLNPMKGRKLGLIRSTPLLPCRGFIAKNVPLQSWATNLITF
jgi:hypothetical protein